MKTVIRLFAVAVFALGFAACKKQEAADTAVKAPMAAPTTDDVTAWKAYLSDLVPRHMEGISNQPYIYLLPGESTPDFADAYTRLAEKAKADVSRSIVAGNMLAYASPASSKMADMVVDAFKDVPAGAMKGVRVLFIGKPADNDRVKAAVAASGVDYVFVEAK